MKVGELITELKKFPLDTIVLCEWIGMYRDGEDFYHFTLEERKRGMQKSPER